MACYSNRASQFYEKSFERDKARRLNQSIKTITRNPTTYLKFTVLYKGTVHIHAYANPAFSTNYYLTSQIDIFIVLCNVKNKSHVLDFSNKKSKRIVRSITVGEISAFIDTFAVSSIVLYGILDTLGMTFSDFMFTVSKQLFDLATERKMTNKKNRLLLAFWML